MEIDQIPFPPIAEELCGRFKNDIILLNKEYGDEAFTKREGLISAYDVLRAHYFVVDYFYSKGGDAVFDVGIKFPNMLMSAIDRAFVGYSGQDKWKNVFEKVASVYYGLIKNHPFHDANKRTAFLTVNSILYEKKIVVTDKYINDFEDLTVNVADNKLEKYRSYRKKYKNLEDGEILFIAKWIKRRHRKIDKKYYTITYRQLDSALRRFGFSLCDPSGNFIHVCNPKGERICEIGFPSWGAQVGKKAIKTVLQTTGLKPEKGYDAATFFKGEEPYAYIINKYKKNFESLKHR